MAPSVLHFWFLKHTSCDCTIFPNTVHALMGCSSFKYLHNFVTLLQCYLLILLTSIPTSTLISNCKQPHPHSFISESLYSVLYLFPIDCISLCHLIYFYIKFMVSLSPTEMWAPRGKQNLPIFHWLNPCSYSLVHLGMSICTE